MHKVYGDHEPIAKQEGRFECGFESPSDMKEDDGVQVCISGGKLGASVSLSYLQSIPKKMALRLAMAHKAILTSALTYVMVCACVILCNMCHGFHPQDGYSRRKKDRLRKAMKRTPSNLIGLQEHVQSPDKSSSEKIASQGEVRHVYIRSTFFEVCILPPSTNGTSV